MSAFLKEIAEKVASYEKLYEWTFVFPNRRAGLFFQKYLSLLISKPSWSPNIISIESLFSSLSDLREPDRLSLIFRLYNVYKGVMNGAESFDKFYFWGEMLLRDFDEVDKYMVNAPLLFKDLSRLKELDESYDFLTDEQKEFLKNFWINFDDKPAKSKAEFLKVWRQLPKVYSEFTKTLRKEKLGYEGMVHKEVAEKMKKGLPKSLDPSKMIFAGFNALTKAEELVMSKCVEEGAQVYWDLDDYYMSNPAQEAGQFFRLYKKHPILSRTFSAYPSNFSGSSKTVELTGVPQRIGQAKHVGQVLESLDKSIMPESIVIVLPDESMLLPVLHSIPASLDEVNVTMGFPLRNTPLYTLLDLMIELQLFRKGNSFSHRQVTPILGHAYILALAKEQAQFIRNGIIRNNRVYIHANELQEDKNILLEIFQEVEPNNASGYLLGVVQQLGASFSTDQSFDREYAFHFHRHLARLHELLDQSEGSTDWRGFQKLFRQVMLSQKIPFSGEPLKGLQIMGVLETRNLDFENAFVLSLNEGMLPPVSRQGSYIPHSIRKAYQLPTYEQHDAIYAYLYYRLLQRAKNIRMYYNTEPDIIGNGEMSRFVQQVLFESGLKVKHGVLHNEVQIHTPDPVTIKKNPATVELLNKYLNSASSEIRRELTPSALNEYIECRLKFYLKYVAGLREADEVEEDLDARIFGNLLHDIANWFYKDLLDQQGGLVEAKDLENTSQRIGKLVDKAFIKLYNLNPEQEVNYTGQRVVVRNIVQEFMNKIVEQDKKNVPFTLIALEEKFSVPVQVGAQKILLGGKIDRIDRVGETVRIIDYKTGRDELGVESIASLFNREGKRNKAAFQTMLYGLLYQKQKNISDVKVIPGLLNRKNLFSEDFSFGHPMGKGRDRELLADAEFHYAEFETLLMNLLKELFDPETHFDQTTNHKACTFCSYKSICRR